MYIEMYINQLGKIEVGKKQELWPPKNFQWQVNLLELKLWI